MKALLKVLSVLLSQLLLSGFVRSESEGSRNNETNANENSTSSSSCEYSKLITPCDLQTRTLNVIYFWKTNSTRVNCQDSLIPKSELNVDCSLDCDKGYFYDYKSKECRMCGKNTYSLGGGLRYSGIYNEWTDENLKEFDNKCYFYVRKNRTEGLNCKPFKALGSRLYAGEGGKELGIIVYLLTKRVTLKKAGRVLFTYRKQRSTTKDAGSENSSFRFFVNYKERMNDKNQTLNYATRSFYLEPGNYILTWEFEKIHEGEGGDLVNPSVILDSIEIEGVEPSSYECLPCKNSLSAEGSSECLFCKRNHYFDRDQSKCILCPNNTITDPNFNSLSVSDCVENKPCDIDDYDYTVTECMNGEKNRIFIQTSENFCSPSKFVPTNGTIPCEDCEDGQYEETINSKHENYVVSSCNYCQGKTYSNETSRKNFKGKDQCVECGPGKHIIKSIKFNSKEDFQSFENTCVAYDSRNCKHVKGFELRNNLVKSGKNLPSDLTLRFSTQFMTTSYDIVEVRIRYFVSFLTVNERVTFRIGNNVIFNHDKYGEAHEYHEWFVVKEKGTLDLVIEYTRDGAGKTTNTFTLHHIIIKGSTLGGGSTCSFCPDGYFNKGEKGDNVCKKCPPGEMSNFPLMTECIKCQDYENAYEDSLGNSCQTCPDFTFSEPTKDRCSLNDVVQNNALSTRFFVANFKESVKKLCNNNLGLCYQSFIGPIKKDILSEKLFFISLFRKDDFNFSQMTVEEKTDNPNFLSGHIFGLFNDKVEETSQQRIELILNKKKLFNLGGKINKVQIIRGSIAIDLKIPDGLLVHYDAGDFCGKDRKKRFETYVFLSCSKDSRTLYPKYIMQSDDECTFYFEWKSKWNCPSCTKSETNVWKSPCINKKMTVSYDEGPQCLIRNIVDPAFFKSKSNNSPDNVIFRVDQLSEEKLSFFRQVDKRRDLHDSRRLNTNTNPISSNKSQSSFIDGIINSLIEEDNNQLFLNEVVSEQVPCTFLDSLNSKLNVIFFIIPFVYVLLIIIGFCCFCRYRKKFFDYNKLVADYEAINRNQQRRNQSHQEESIDIDN